MTPVTLANACALAPDAVGIVELLLAGVPIDQVSILLGHSSAEALRALGEGAAAAARIGGEEGVVSRRMSVARTVSSGTA